MSTEEVRTKPYAVEAESNSLDARQLGAPARKFAITLCDDALSALGYGRGDKVEVLVGEIYGGELAAVLTTDGHWYVGFVIAAAGALLISTCADRPRRLPLGRIIGLGRVVSRQGRAVLQAGIALPAGGTDRVRLRHQL